MNCEHPRRTVTAVISIPELKFPITHPEKIEPPRDLVSCDSCGRLL